MRYSCLIRSGCIALAVAFTSPSAAQTPKPADTVAGVEVATVESLKGWVQSGTDWTGKFGGSGEVLRDATKGFDLSDRWKARFGAVTKLSERSRNALPIKLAPQLFQAADVINSVALPFIAGDGRGTVSGAVDLGATSAVSTAGTAGGEWLGTVIGGTVGCWVPVVGNVVGATVGGAVGGFAGGYLAGAGYESYLKGSVVNAVEAGIAMLVDPDPLVQKMQAHEAALYRKLSPELAEMIRTSQSLGGGELQLQDWGRLVTAPAPVGATPEPKPPQDQAALTTGNVLAGVRKFRIGKMEWEINGGVATHRQVYPGPATSVVTARGTVFPNRIEGTMVWTFPGDTNCDVRESEHFVYVFDAENVSARNQPGPVELRGPCKGTWDKIISRLKFHRAVAKSRMTITLAQQGFRGPCAAMVSALALLLVASIHGAQAQELRAAPPAEPGVLKRAPEQVAGVEVATVESLKGWVQSGTDWAGKFGDSGEVLRDATKGFDLSDRWKARVNSVAKLSERSRNALPIKLAPQLFQAADVINAVAFPLIAGDGRGTVSGAVDLGATSAVSTAGTAGGEWLGTVIGGTVGCWVPVVGNVVGATVGGAVGGFAGGYLAGAGYESYLKGSVVNAVEAGIAMLVDTDPLVQKMQAHEAALYRLLSPELAEMIKTSASFGGGEMQLQDWGRLVATPAQDQAALGGELPASFVLNQNSELNQPVICKISGQAVACSGQHTLPLGQVTYSLSGTVNGNTLNVQSRSLLLTKADKCNETVEYLGHEQIVLQVDGRASTDGSFNMRVLARSGYCGSPTSLTGNHSLVGTWKARIE